MKKTFTDTVPYSFNHCLSALEKAGQTMEDYRQLDAPVESFLWESGGVTFKEWLTKKSMTLKPRTQTAVSLHAISPTETRLTVTITRMGLLDPLGLLKQEFDQLMDKFHPIISTHI